MVCWGKQIKLSVATVSQGTVLRMVNEMGWVAELFVICTVCVGNATKLRLAWIVPKSRANLSMVKLNFVVSIGAECFCPP